MSLPKRSDPIYQEIEKFEDYEYTNCIAYEMAVRNDEVITIIEQIKAIIDLVTSQDLEYDIYSFLFSEMSLNLEERKKYETLANKLKSYGVDYINHEFFYNTELSRDIPSALRTSFAMVFSLSKEKMNEILKIEYDFIEGLGISDKEKFNLRERVLKNGCVYQEDSKTIIKEHFRKENLKIDGLSFNPVLKFDSNVNYDISLNLNLPKDELIAYISKIKDEYDKDNSIIKSPLELIGDDFNKANTKINKNKMADWFYVYDLYKIKKNENPKMADIDIFAEIDLTLLDHYDSQKENYFSEKTYKTIKAKMTYLIDELGYKELITGTTNKG